tara:strand:- start:2251 stop:3279 length:1029 start_codon:yes stop_codon:yes gene_type:complete
MKIYVKTFGCNLNKRDSENIKGVLQEAGFVLTNEEKADVIIVNSCGVKAKTQSRVISYINKHKKDVYVGGCLPRMLDLKERCNAKGYFDTNSILKIAEQIRDERLESFSNKKENRLNQPLVRTYKDIMIIPISEGCLGNCNYCSTKLARGNLKSYTIKDIIKEVKNNGFETLYLTSQDCGCYGLDIGTNLVELLEAIISVDKEFKIRVGMMNPEHVLPMLDPLIALYKHEKVIKFIHIPVQSGSDKVLKDMGRKYTVAEFKKIVKKFRKVEGLHISTDIIAGYPTESEQDFEKTKELLTWLKPHVLNLSKFGSRPNTAAAKLKPLSSQEVKKRSKEIKLKFL